MNFWDNVDVSAGPGACWPWLRGTNPDGYGQMSYKGKVWLTHRLAWTLDNGPIPDGLCILHSCDNPPCVNPAHLRPGTKANNAHDRDERGRRTPPKGVTNGRAKLDDDKVRDMRRLYATGWYTQAELGALFGVARARVSRIVRCEEWTHVR